jgi:hypothetical protein
LLLWVAVQTALLVAPAQEVEQEQVVRELLDKAMQEALV